MISRKRFRYIAFKSALDPLLYIAGFTMATYGLYVGLFVMAAVWGLRMFTDYSFFEALDESVVKGNGVKDEQS